MGDIHSAFYPHGYATTFDSFAAIRFPGPDAKRTFVVHHGLDFQHFRSTYDYNFALVDGIPNSC